MSAWGFNYKSNIVWHKIRKDGGSDGRGFYFRNVTELILFGTRGKSARTLAPGRRQVNLLATRKREHSRKPDEQYRLIEEPIIEATSIRCDQLSKEVTRPWLPAPIFQTVPNYFVGVLLSIKPHHTTRSVDRKVFVLKDSNPFGCQHSHRGTKLSVIS